MLKRENYLKLYGITEEQVDTLRPLNTLKFSEVNEICSIIIGKEVTCGKIDWVGDKNFLVAVFKKEEYHAGNEKYEWVEMGISINSDFEVNYFWDYCNKNGRAQSSQQLYNHNELTAYLINKKFDVFKLQNTVL